MDSFDDILKDLMATPGDQPLDSAAVTELYKRYPSFLLPAILQLRHPHPDIDETTAAQLIERISLSIPSRQRVRILIDPEGTGRYDKLYPDLQTKQSPTTNDTIETFLSTYGNINPEEEALLNRMIFNPVPDYAASLERENPIIGEPLDEQDKILDAFIAADRQFSDPEITEQPAAETKASILTNTEKENNVQTHNEPPAQHNQAKAPAGSLLSESLAKIFIKQHNYRRAYEIISSINLNYPEKSIYFADQLRFLKKLIANQEAQERQNKEKN